MSMHIRIDDFLGRKVVDVDGQTAGHVHEVRVERQGGDYVITEFVIGVVGMLERLGVEVWRTHAGGHARGYVASWQQMDLSDPRHPRVHCKTADLRKWPSQG